MPENNQEDPVVVFEFILDLDNLRALLSDVTTHKVHISLETQSIKFSTIPTISVKSIT